MSNLSLNLSTFLPLVDTLTFPEKLQPFAEPIKDEIRWVIHTSMLMGRRRKISTPFGLFVINGIERMIDYYAPRKIMPFLNIYDLCDRYGMYRSNYHGSKHTLSKYLAKYQKKS
jgi:hypothetical protein